MDSLYVAVTASGSPGDRDGSPVLLCGEQSVQVVEWSPEVHLAVWRVGRGLEDWAQSDVRVREEGAGRDAQCETYVSHTDERGPVVCVRVGGVRPERVLEVWVEGRRAGRFVTALRPARSSSAAQLEQQGRRQLQAVQSALGRDAGDVWVWRVRQDHSFSVVAAAKAPPDSAPLWVYCTVGFAECGADRVELVFRLRAEAGEVSPPAGPVELLAVARRSFGGSLDPQAAVLPRHGDLWRPEADVEVAEGVSFAAYALVRDPDARTIRGRGEEAVRFLCLAGFGDAPDRWDDEQSSDLRQELRKKMTDLFVHRSGP